jgi:ABC-type dipeptide/oligopeptide/nickel transport system permease subunit
MSARSIQLVWLGAGCLLLACFLIGGFLAPENLSSAQCSAFKRCVEGPLQVPPFGTDLSGIPLWEYALQGAKIVTLPAIISGCIVAAFAALAGLARCASLTWVDTLIQMVAEIMGALPRMVVILVIALAIPKDWRGLMPIGIAWALMAAPGAMDEAAACAGRLGGARFVEALRAHGFSAMRIYGYHISWLNLRAVLVRQGAEVAMQVVFLEIALSYLAVPFNEPAFTHSDSTYSWAKLLYFGYQSIVSGDYWGDGSLVHALILGLGLVAVTALLAQTFRLAARER